MARRAALLLRMLLSLALIVAAMPLRASAPPCPASPPKKAAAKCAMPCCAEAGVEIPAAEMACCKAKKDATNLDAACRCELKASFPAPAVESKATLPSFGSPLYALPEAVRTLRTVVLIQGEPGVFGTDSGPPISPPTASDASRAPPVARA